jgi:hypothetical protein
MTEQIAKTRKRLNELANKILNPSYGRAPSIREWGGADVVIRYHNFKPSGNPSWYPEPRWVVTPNAKPLSKLFYNLRDTFYGMLDGCSKIEFYGRLATAALNYQEGLQGKPEDATELLKAVLKEAEMMLAEMEQRNFQVLNVAPGGAIWADLVNRKNDDGSRWNRLSVERRFV